MRVALDEWEERAWRAGSLSAKTAYQRVVVQRAVLGWF